MKASDRTKIYICMFFKELCKETSFNKIKVKDIIEKCGMSKSTFYYHFRDKEDVVNYIFQSEISKQVRKMINQMPVSEWTTIISFCLNKMYEDSYLYIPAMRYTGQNSLGEYALSETIESWATMSRKLFDGRKKPSEKSQILIDYLYEFYARGQHSSVMKWAKGGMKESPETLSLLINYASIGVANLALFFAEQDSQDILNIPIEDFYGIVSIKSDRIKRSVARKVNSDIIAAYLQSSSRSHENS